MRNPLIPFAWRLMTLVLLAPVALAATVTRQDGIELITATIPMADGVNLAADLYLPAERDSADRLPVLLEYLPYRKTESRARNFRHYSYFVQRGYAVARVDIRGTGNSEGRLIPHEYSDIELDDGEVVIDWLSKQPWSNGNVGMFGISWGGFNAIMMAVRNPPALKTIIAVDATEDLYQDDVHYMDGIMHVDAWEMEQDLDNARPGAPDYVIDDDYFANRFDTPPWMLTYKNQQRDGEFWDRASSRDKYDQIRIPTFHIGGYYDGYRDSIARMLENVRNAPVKAMIGPWSHAFPHEPYPKPGMEWRREAVRWFDHWLKGIDTGIMDEPRFAVYVRHWHAPGPHLEFAPGYWRWEDGWPLARTDHQSWYADSRHGLGRGKPAAAAEHRLAYVPSSGIEAGGPVMWWGDVAPDQRPTDAMSLTYDSAPLEAPIEILGFPTAHLTVAADARQANWFVRISDVAPDGRATLITGAGMNGTHRHSARNPEYLEPGEFFPLDVEMHFTSWVFPKGHRIRISIGNAQWPMLWPTPEPMTTSLIIGGDAGARIELPVVPPGEERSPQFAPPAASPSLDGFGTLEAGTSSGYGEISSIDRNPQTGETVVIATNANGSRYPWGTETFQEKIEHRTSDNHPERTSMRGSHVTEVRLNNGRELVWEAELDFTSDAENFYYHYVRRLRENGKLVREKSWNDTIPRDFQ